MSISIIWPIDKTLSDVTTAGQSGSESESNKGVLHIPQSSSPSFTIRLFDVISRTFAGGVLPHPAEMQSVYSTAPADRAIHYTAFKQTLQTELLCWKLSHFFRFILIIKSNLIQKIKITYLLTWWWFNVKTDTSVNNSTENKIIHWIPCFFFHISTFTHLHIHLYLCLCCCRCRHGCRRRCIISFR